MGRKAVNWNNQTEGSTAIRFWNQNVQQTWFPEDYNPAEDKATWDLLGREDKDVFKKALVKLTHLDTEQFGQGMPLILVHTKNQNIASVFAYMTMMEAVHAKSYSNIFMSLITDRQEERELFTWQEDNVQIQRIADIIVGYYHKLLSPTPNKKDIYMALVASVFLESFLFYSGFFFPLYLAGQGKMIHSAEIIYAILKDESIHGVLVGIEAQNAYSELNEEDQVEVETEVYNLLNELFSIEVIFTREVYAQVGLVDEVTEFVKYNANKALSNLGRPSYFEDVKVNPIILNGIDTETKNHDFFSTKGNYVRSVNLRSISDTNFAKLETMLGKSFA
jgi:ribonucleoside-diphosphate reductase beta chain